MKCRMCAFVLGFLPLAAWAGSEAGEIHAAAGKGDLQAVKALLDKDPKGVSAEDKNGETPLHEAARRGHKLVAALLIARQADLNAHNGRVYWDSTPLMYAVVGGHRDVLKLLLDKGADPNHQRRTWQVSALHDAVGKDDVEAVRLLLAHKADPNVIRRNKGGGTPLHQAKGEPMVKLLLAHGADVNARNGAGRTVLHEAVRWGRAARAALLLAGRADPNAPDNAGLTPLHLAAQGDAQRLPIVTRLLAGRADPNAAAFDGATPLHLAARSGAETIVKALLAHKADAAARAADGRTALHYAAAGQRRLAVVRLLLAAGLDAKLADRQGRTALHAAAGTGEKDVVEALLAGGAAPAAADGAGRRSLHEAARLGRAEAAGALLAHGAEPTAADRRGQTPLHLAAREGHKAVVEALLAAGADVAAANRYGETALFAARSRGHKEIVQALLAKGARDVSPARPAPSPPGAKSPKADLAEFIVSRLKMRRGLAIDLGCGDGALAVAVARRTRLDLTCLDDDAQAVRAARERLEADGLYGTRATAHVAKLDKLAYPDASANLIFCGDELAAGLRGRSLREIHRVLSPNGVAVIGQGPRPAAKTGRLSRQRLEGWLKDAGIAGGEIVAANGLWACLSRARPAGSDEWRFRCHDPGNTHGSDDRLAVGPLKSRWIADWRTGDSAASIVVGDGRVFLASLAYQARSGYTRLPTGTPYLRAIDAYTGRVLWARVGPEELPCDRGQSNYGAIQIDIALLGDSLYLLGGRACYEFDAASGTSRRLLPIPAAVGAGEKDVWLYLSSAGSLLYGSSGPPTGIRGSWALKYPRGNSSALFAIDRKTGTCRWVSRRAAMTGSLAIGEGKLFFCDVEYGLHALDAATGKELWTRPDSGFSKKTDIVRGIYYGGKYWLVHHPTSGLYLDLARARNRKALKNLVSDPTRNARKVAAFSARDGRRLFDCDLGEAVAGVSFAAGTVYGASQHHSRGYLTAADAETGKRKWRLGGYFKCTPVIAAANCVFVRSTVATCLDVRAAEGSAGPKSLRWLKLAGYRPTCTYPGIPANGLLYIQGPGCNCPFPVRASSAMAPGTPAAPDAAGRLVKGPAFGQDVPAPADPHPWRSWRADARRSAVSAEPVANGAAFKRLWAVRLGGRLQPAVAAGGAVFVASSDHRLCALDAATGKRKWRYFAAGRAGGPAWLDRGRLFLGDDDGWVHCLRADDGELIWRFRAAPAVDRVVGYGRYASRWPVRGGVLGDGPTVYFSAGFFPQEGCFTYALDAATGQLRWEKAHGTRFNPRGPMALAGKKLYAPCGWGPPQMTGLDDTRHRFRPIRQFGAATQWTCAYGISVTDEPQEVLMRMKPTSYVHWRGNYVIRSSDPVLPVVEAGTIYRRGRYLSAERRGAFRVSVNGRFQRKDSRWDPGIVKWQAWKGVPMTAIAKAGGAVFTGGPERVYVTADDGRELCSAPVPGAVEDLSFNGGRLFATCQGGWLVCFGK